MWYIHNNYGLFIHEYGLSTNKLVGGLEHDFHFSIYWE